MHKADSQILRSEANLFSSSSTSLDSELQVYKFMQRVFFSRTHSDHSCDQHRHYLLLLVVVAGGGGAAVFVAIRPFGAEDNCFKQMKQRDTFFSF